MIANESREKNGWATRLLLAACERAVGWMLSHQLGASPYMSLMFFGYCGYGIEEALTYQSLTCLEMEEELSS